MEFPRINKNHWVRGESHKGLIITVTIGGVKIKRRGDSINIPDFEALGGMNLLHHNYVRQAS